MITHHKSQIMRRQSLQQLNDHFLVALVRVEQNIMTVFDVVLVPAASPFVRRKNVAYDQQQLETRRSSREIRVVRQIT